RNLRQLHRQRTQTQLRGETLRRARREPTRDLATTARRDSFWKSAGVDLWDAHQLVIQCDGEGLIQRPPTQNGLLAPPRYLRRDVLEESVGVAFETERDIRGAILISARLRVADLVSA